MLNISSSCVSAYCCMYLGHIRNVDHLLDGGHVAHNANIQRVHDLTVRWHQAVIEL